MRAATAEDSGSPWLSLLVPAYEFPEGLARILRALDAPQAAGVECVVHDDSTSDAVQELVQGHRACLAGRVRYRRNRPALGAVRNWNSLVAAARGTYAILMHHDEFPDTPDFFTQVRAQLERLDSPDILILRCMLPSVGGRWRLHMPPWLQRTLVRMAPSHLLRHNTIGPTACLVLRRERLQAFDERLQWLVDVEWSHRLLTAAGVRWELADVSVLSSQKPGGSITASLAGRTTEIARIESKMVQARLGRLPALRLQAPETLGERLLARLEHAIWLGVRAAVRLSGLLARQPQQPVP